MSNIRRKSWLIGVYFFMFIVSYNILQAQFSDAFLAVVGDKVITFFDLQQMIGADEVRLNAAYSGKELEEKVAALRKQGLDTLIEHELMYREFQALGAKVPVEMLQERINSIVQNVSGGNVVKFEDYLHSRGMTMEKYREQLSKNLAVELLTRDRISRGNVVSDARVQDFFQREKAKLAIPRRFRIAVIQLGKEGKYKDRVDVVYNEIMDKMKNGTPFEELVKEYSEGSNVEKGGDQGWLNGMHENIMDVIKNLEPGQTADKMANIGSNFYIVKVLDVEAGGVPELTPELTEKIRQKLIKDEETRRYKAYIRELYMKFPVRRMDGM